MKIYKNGILVNSYTQSEADSVVFEKEHEYVDLGLSVKWATCNIGASTPEGYGDYFAWGETSPKENYSWETYKYCQGTNVTITKYCADSAHGTVDNKSTLESEDDAAHVNWGDNWRMPTISEMEELVNNCTITRTNQNGVDGRLFVSNKNGKSIFLPAAGQYIDSIFRPTTNAYSGSEEYVGLYLSSSLYESNASECRNLIFGETFCKYWGSRRIYGRSVRAVCP